VKFQDNTSQAARPVTIALFDVPLEDALDVLCRATRTKLVAALNGYNTFEPRD